MSFGLAACRVAVWILLLGVHTAAAERRPVAVIDLAAEAGSPAEATAKQLAQILVAHPDLAPVADPTLPNELIGPLEDPDAERLQAAWQAKQEADKQLADFQFSVAAQGALTAQTDLLLAMPTANVVQTYAELAFVLGQARLGERKAGEAAQAFSLAHRLAPSFAPDPARYLPEVVQAYDAAKSAPVHLVELAVGGKGRVWIDGKEHGAAPVALEVPTGIHVVWITGQDRETRGTRVTIVQNTPQKLALDDAPASDRLKVRRARMRLKFAPDPTARAAAIQQLAQLVGVGDAVLLSVGAPGKLIVQTWRDRAPGFSALREVKPGEAPAELLKPLAPPPKQVVKPDPIRPIKPIPKPPPFYRQRKWQAVMLAGVVGIVAGSIVIYRNRDTTLEVDTNPGFGESKLR